MKLKKSIKSGLKSSPKPRLKKQPREYNPMNELLDEELIARAIWECLKENDPDGVMEILQAHMSAKNKSQLAKKHDLARTTLYHAFKGKNPTLHTLAKLIHAAA